MSALLYDAPCLWQRVIMCDDKNIAQDTLLAFPAQFWLFCYDPYLPLHNMLPV